MEKISWTEHVKNEEVLHSTKKERNILRTVRRRKANRIGHAFRRILFLKHVIEGKVEGTRRRKQLLDDLKENRRSWNVRRKD